jgi:hypothetical protein
MQYSYGTTPSVSRTHFRATSIPVASARSTRQFAWWRTTRRMGSAMSDGFSAAVAT